ncbi:MAG: hypothetical protein J6S32_00975, partial [Clostridia bacterium]|nr:hypothetical protein [Clostridia bacterium]
IAKVLYMTEQQADNLIKNTELLLKELVLDGDKPITAETMEKYFVAENEEASLPVVGYYIGLYLTYTSIKKGFSFQQLATLPHDEILKLWLS